MRDSAVIRLQGEVLLWYPPGAGEAPRTLDSAEAREALREFILARRTPLLFAVPGSKVLLRQVEFSAAERKHIGKSLPFTLEEQLAEDIDELHFAWQMLDRQSLDVAICRHQDMQHWSQQLAELPPPVQWAPEQLLLPLQPGEWCLVIEEDTALLRSGSCSGFSVEPEMLTLFLEQALGAEDTPERLICYGRDQAADLALLPAALRDVVQWRAGDFATAIMLSDEQRHGINLLQGQYAPRLPMHRWWRQWRAVAAFFAVAFVLQLAATYASYVSLEQENLALRAEIEGRFREVFPKGRMQEPEKQVRRQLDALRGSTQSAGFTNLVFEVGKVVAAQPGMRIASINYNERGGDLRLNLVAGDFEAVEAVRAAMTSAGLEAVMESSNAQGDAVRARMRVKAG